MNIKIIGLLGSNFTSAYGDISTFRIGILHLSLHLRSLLMHVQTFIQKLIVLQKWRYIWLGKILENDIQFTKFITVFPPQFCAKWYLWL